MKLAIPVFSGRVAPVFDWCHEMLVVETSIDGTITNRKEETLGGELPFDRIQSLIGLNIDVLLCGGISPNLADMTEARGIRIVPWVAGEIDAVLDEFLGGRLPNERFMMPGAGGGGGNRRCGRHRRGRGGMGNRKEWK